MQRLLKAQKKQARNITFLKNKLMRKLKTFCNHNKVMTIKTLLLIASHSVYRNSINRPSNYHRKLLVIMNNRLLMINQCRINVLLNTLTNKLARCQIQK